MNHAAEKWHRASGNWRVPARELLDGTRTRTKRRRYKVFRLFDSDNSGVMHFEELREVLRSGYPGLGLDEKAVPDPYVKGLWRALDEDASGHVSVQEFMVL